MEKFKIGIVGHGFVGQAVDYGFENDIVEKFYVDPKYDTTIDELANWNPNITFVCLPTPMGENGVVDSAAVEDAVLKVARLTKGAVILKSTLPPNVIDSLCQTLFQYNLYKRFVYNPEFLTEKNSIEQYVYPHFHIVGGHEDACAAFGEVIDKFSIITPAPIIPMHPVEASFVKYAINSFLATKVTFFNQLYDAVKEHPTSRWNVIANAVSADPRIGGSHTKVPGYDKKRGFGGACFPKDTNAFTMYTDKMSLLAKAIEINNDYRLEYELDEREKEQNVSYKGKGTMQ